MNSKLLGRRDIDMKKWLNVLLMMLILTNLVGCGKSWEGKENAGMERDGQSAENQSSIDSGTEVQTDINGDGKTDRVRVYDTVSGDYAFTQVSAILNDDSNFFI